MLPCSWRQTRVCRWRLPRGIPSPNQLSSEARHQSVPKIAGFGVRGSDFRFRDLVLIFRAWTPLSAHTKSPKSKWPKIRAGQSSSAVGNLSRSLCLKFGIRALASLHFFPTSVLTSVHSLCSFLSPYLLPRIASHNRMLRSYLTSGIPTPNRPARAIKTP